MTDRSQARDDVEVADIVDLVLWREREIGRRLAAIDEHRQMLAVELLPSLAARRDELARAERRLAEVRERDAAHARVDALLSSWSWRVTAPARRIYEWFRS